MISSHTGFKITNKEWVLLPIKIALMLARKEIAASEDLEKIIINRNG